MLPIAVVLFLAWCFRKPITKLCDLLFDFLDSRIAKHYQQITEAKEKQVEAEEEHEAFFRKLKSLDESQIRNPSKTELKNIWLPMAQLADNRLRFYNPLAPRQGFLSAEKFVQELIKESEEETV